MKHLVLALIAFSSLVALPTAYAGKHSKGSSHEQRHHCVKDGERIEAKGRKQCRAAGGTWEKDPSGGSRRDPKSSQ